MVTALAVDLRDSTQLAAGRLPFDALFILDQYIRAVTAAIRKHGGLVTSVAGDGIMSVFGLDNDAAAGARNALAAAEDLWTSIDDISVRNAADLQMPLRFGIGVHSGISVVGAVGFPDHTSIQFLGDTGNIAARLESMTKEIGCTMIVSEAAAKAARLTRTLWRPVSVTIRGHQMETMAAYAICTPEELMVRETKREHGSVSG